MTADAFENRIESPFLFVAANIKQKYVLELLLNYSLILLRLCPEKHFSNTCSGWIIINVFFFK